MGGGGGNFLQLFVLFTERSALRYERSFIIIYREMQHNETQNQNITTYFKIPMLRETQVRPKKEII